MAERSPRSPRRRRWDAVEESTDPDVVLSVAARRGGPRTRRVRIPSGQEGFDVDEVCLSPVES